jgi:hypothetical protein
VFLRFIWIFALPTLYNLDMARLTWGSLTIEFALGKQTSTSPARHTDPKDFISFDAEQILAKFANNGIVAIKW